MPYCSRPSMAPLRRASAHAAISLLAGALTVSCATSSDPHDGGFINGVRGISTGAYQQRVDQQKHDLDQLNQTNAALQQRRQEIEQERTEAEAATAALRQQLVDVQRHAERSRAELADLQKNHRIRREKLNALNAQRDAIERQVIDLLKRNGVTADSPNGSAEPPHPPSAADTEAAKELGQKQKALDDAIAAVYGK